MCIISTTNLSSFYNHLLALISVHSRIKTHLFQQIFSTLVCWHLYIVGSLVHSTWLNVSFSLYCHYHCITHSFHFICYTAYYCLYRDWELAFIKYLCCLVAFTGTLNVLTHCCYYFSSHLFICTYFISYLLSFTWGNHIVSHIYIIIYIKSNLRWPTAANANKE